MQSEIAVENCHLALSVMEWCGQEKRGAAFPPPQKVYCCLYFSTPRLAKGSGLYISSWSRGGCYLKCLYRQGSRGSCPGCWNSYASNSHLIGSALSPGPTQPTSAEVDAPAAVPLMTHSPCCLLLRCPGHFSFWGRVSCSQRWPWTH